LKEQPCDIQATRKPPVWPNVGVRVAFRPELNRRIERHALLAQLVAEARANRLRVDKAPLAYDEAGRITFLGIPDLVKYLATRGVPMWRHTLDV
jgi:hypothetical protein